MGSSLNVRKWLERYVIVKNGPPPRGILTGYPFLDNKLGGLQKGRFVVLMGVPGIGKTALCLEFGMEASRQVAVLHVSRKEAPADLCERLLLQANDLHSLPQTGQDRFSASAHLWQELRYAYVFEDCRGQSLAELLEGIRRKAKELLEVSEPLGLVVVDGTEGIEQDPEVVGEALAQLARELDVCLILTVPSGLEPERSESSGSSDWNDMHWQKYPDLVVVYDYPATADGPFLLYPHARPTLVLSEFRDHFIGPRQERFRLLRVVSVNGCYAAMQLEFDRDSGRMYEGAWSFGNGAWLVAPMDSLEADWLNCDQDQAREDYKDD